MRLADSLFEQSLPTPAMIGPAPAKFRVRPYQEDALGKIGEAFDAGCRRVLIVMPTGTGKTEIFVQAVQRFARKRALVIVHRKELADQAARRIRERTGKRVSVERGDVWASTHGEDDVVVALVQSLSAGRGDGKRMHRFDPSMFDLVVVDEAHHAVASSWRKSIDHFLDNQECLLLGVTATPDRADEKALGHVFEAIAAEYQLLAAIRDGWLVPIRCTPVECSGLDLSSVGTTAGDLNQGQLAEVVERDGVVREMAYPIIEIAGDRKTLVFCSSVAQAVSMSDALCSWRAGSSAVVDGKTPEDVRDQLFRRFGTGELQYLVNVGIATEGWDDPSTDRPVSVVAMCRPTKSRSLFAQMVGRGTRPVPGLVDPFDVVEHRVAAIANSIKPFVEVLDFVGNAGKHTLATVADLLMGDDLEDDEMDALRARVRKSKRSVNVEEELDAMRAEAVAARDAASRERQAVRVKSWYSTTSVDPFALLGVTPVRERGWDSGRHLTDRQRSILTSRNIDPDSMGYTNAKRCIDAVMKRDMPTAKQVAALAKHGVIDPALTFKESRLLLDRIAGNGWTARGLDLNAIRAEAANAGAPF